MIHKYKLHGYNVVLDVNSGGVHLVDDLTYDMLDNVAPPFSDVCPPEVVEKLSAFYQEADILSCYDEVLEAYNEQILFSEDDYEKYADCSVASPIKAMCLHIAHDCNLRCEYCFASTGDFGEGRKLMPLETGKQAIDFLLKHSANRKNLELDFFGGEPLMNFEVVKQVVAYARSKEQEYGKHFRFTITTNGMLLNDDNIDFINKEMSNVVLSIDGRKAVNDRMRKRVDGKGSYDIILPKYQRLVAQRGDKEYYVRGTYTKYNLDFSNDVFDLLEHGFDQISVEPVMADENDPYAITEADLPAIFKEYEVLMNKILDYEKTGKKFNFFHFMLDLDQGPCAIVAVAAAMNMLQLHRTVTFIRAISLLEWKNGRWATLKREHSTRQRKQTLQRHISTPSQIVGNAGQDSIAAAVAMRTTTSMLAIFGRHISSLAKLKRSGWNVRLS